MEPQSAADLIRDGNTRRLPPPFWSTSNAVSADILALFDERLRWRCDAAAYRDIWRRTPLRRERTEVLNGLLDGQNLETRR